MRARTMREDLREFSGEQLLLLSVMSNRQTRVLIDLELRRRAAARRAGLERRVVDRSDHRVAVA